MRYIYTLCFLLICSWGRTQAPELLTKKEAKFVSGIFAGAFLAESIPLPVREPAYEGLVMDGDRLYLFKNQEKVLGYLLSTRAKGRYDYFDYSVAFSEDLSLVADIRRVHLLIRRLENDGKMP